MGSGKERKRFAAAGYKARADPFCRANDLTVAISEGHNANEAGPAELVTGVVEHLQKPFDLYVIRRVLAPKPCGVDAGCVSQSLYLES